MQEFIKQHVSELFKGRSHLEPIKIGVLWGWAIQTSYFHVSEDTFPVRLTPIGTKKMVSFVHYLEFILNNETASYGKSTLPEPQIKKSRGRPTNKEVAARSALTLSKAGGV